jgi:serine/threonine protein kinase/tetratricopeptide (TPR) repeat protein
MDELTPQQQQQVENLFDHVVGISQQSQDAYLDSSEADPIVIEEIRSLLAYHQAAREQFSSPGVTPQAVLQAVHHVAGLDPAPPLPAPTAIGPYAVLKTLGEGGMGTVYLAEQKEPLKRLVAVKLIKLGMDTRSVVARFKAEQQSLAKMKHANVAQVLDAGATENGRPYFVMEYVEGTRITEFCDTHRLGISDRLALFGQVCDAIQHAHQKGIIHRDIKPSNVLVCTEDGTSVPKVIDFGVAKATDQHSTEHSMFTEHGVLVGTPEYMSPEQATIDDIDIDTRSDIYSLGVLLYELLVGSLPIDTKTLRQAGLEELRRLVRECDPPKPTTRLASLVDRAHDCAEQRGTELPTLIRELRGDLDWIVMKCLEKDRSRRYATAAELLDDLDRFAHDRPVTASPPSVTYQVSKFARRNRGFVVAAMVVACVLAIGVGTTIAFAFGEARQRAAAQLQADTNRAINEFLNEMLASVDPKKARGRDVGILRDVLTEAAGKVEAQLSDQPRVEASVRRTIGRTMMNLGLYDDSAPHLERALEIERSLASESSADLSKSIHLLGSVRGYQGRPDECESLLREALALRRDGSEGDGLRLGATLNKMSEMLLNAGRLDEAKTCMDESRLIHESVYGRGAKEMATVLNLLAAYYSMRGEYDRAEALFRECLAARGESLDDIDTLVTLHNLGVTLQKLERYDEAEAEYLRAREGFARVAEPQHPARLSVSNSLAALMERQGRHAESEALHREVLATLRLTLGDRHPKVHSSLNNLGTVLHAQHKFDEAITMFREAVELAREVHGPNHPVLAMSLAQLGIVLRDTTDKDNYAESEDAILKAVSILESTLPENHPYTLNTLRGLRRLYEKDAMDDSAKLAEVESKLKDAETNSE